MAMNELNKSASGNRKAYKHLVSNKTSPHHLGLLDPELDYSTSRSYNVPKEQVS
jgi:hypothetical protein